MELPQKPKTVFSTKTVLLTILIVVSLFAGGVLGYLLGYSDLQNQLSTLQRQMSNLQTTQGVNQNNTYLLEETSPFQSYICM